MSHWGLLRSKKITLNVIPLENLMSSQLISNIGISFRQRGFSLL
jgi:hypothetical protein